MHHSSLFCLSIYCYSNLVPCTSCGVLEFRPESDVTVIRSDRYSDVEESHVPSVATGLDLAADNGQTTTGSVAEGGGASLASIPNSDEVSISQLSYHLCLVWLPTLSS